MNVTEAGRIYWGDVMHRRLFPVRYRFIYPVFSVLLDLDRLSTLSRGLRLLSYNRFNVFSFNDRDHGPRDGSPLRAWIDAILWQHGIDLDGGRVLLLCFPRIFGYVFNPLSLWYCLHRDGNLRAILCEVSNTFGEHHGYLLHRDGQPMPWPARGCAVKAFHVSPFIGMNARYQFRISRPDADLNVLIRQYQGTDLLLVAAHRARGQPLSDWALARAVALYPFMTLKVMLMIHWQALRIWMKGAPFHRKPEPPAQEVT